MYKATDSCYPFVFAQGHFLFLSKGCIKTALQHFLYNHFMNVFQQKYFSSSRVSGVNETLPPLCSISVLSVLLQCANTGSPQCFAQICKPLHCFDTAEGVSTRHPFTRWCHCLVSDESSVLCQAHLKLLT